MTLFRWLGRAVRPFLGLGIGRLKWSQALWGVFAGYFIGNTVIVRIDGLTVAAPARDGFGFNLLTRGCWEPFETVVFKRSICPGMTVIDIGAHIGLYALTASSIVGLEGKVYAFEPEPENYDLLQRNINLNGFTNIMPIRKAVSDRSGVTMLYVDPKQSTHHSTGRASEGARSIVCEAIRIDDFFEGQKVDVVKIDVEGAEMAVLHGMQRTIAENPQIKLLCEFVPRFLIDRGVEPGDFLARLVNFGFAVHKVDNRRRKVVYVADVSSFLAEEGCYLFCMRKHGALP